MAVSGISGSDLVTIRIIIPPLPEQTAIATALSDVDALISGLDRLIEKKRAIKQAAMQELLTGKRRLPGFDSGKGYKPTEVGEIPEDWELFPFGNMIKIRGEKFNPKKDGVSNYCIELEHISQGKGSIISHSVTNTNSSLKNKFQKNDILFGKLRSYLRKYWLANREGVTSTEIWVFTAINGISVPEFIFQVIQMDDFIECSTVAYGTHMPRADWNVVKMYMVPLPPLPEQTAIATVLSDMDAEISALETRRAKTLSLKQGMMQELLTGRIRLV